MWALTLQTLAITAPVFSMLFLGVLLKQLRWIDDQFVNTASSLVFKGTMPTLLFLAIVQADLSTALQPAVLIYFCLATLCGFALAWAWAAWRVPYADRGVYVQGAFRGNNGIIGLALASSLYGDYGLSLGGVLAGVMIVTYNVLSVFILALYSGNQRPSVRSIAYGIVTNPLILGVVLALPVAAWQWTLPDWLMQSGTYFAQMTLPLALICIGASLSVAMLKNCGSLAISSSLMKMLVTPVLLTAGAYAWGFRSVELGVLFLYFASPTAAASYVMARATGSNYELAAAIVMLTTVMAAVTSNVGIVLMQGLGWL